MNSLLDTNINGNLSTNSNLIAISTKNTKGSFHKQSLGQIPISQQIKVRMQSQTQLSSDFIQLFTKYIVNSNQFKLKDHFQSNVIQYKQFYQALKTINKLKQTRTKNAKQSEKNNINYDFSFQSTNNTIVLLLDLSPYMLSYDYSTQSFPLKNLQQIVKKILRILHQRKIINPNIRYELTCLIFSTNQSELIKVIDKQEINEISLLQISDYILMNIHRCPFPHIKSSQQYPINCILQKVMENLEVTPGSHCMLTISLFLQEERVPRLFYGLQWFTFGFIATGRNNLGSFCIDEEEIQQLFVTSQYFKTKFVFTTQMVQNWEKNLITKVSNTQTGQSGQAKKASPKGDRYRNKSVFFKHQGQYIDDIFELLLVYKLFVQKRLNSYSRVQKSVQSIITKSKQRSRKSYKVTQDSMGNIIKLRYQQGWQPITTNSYIDNTKFIFKLTLNPKKTLYYSAQREKEHFNIKIFQKADFIYQEHSRASVSPNKCKNGSKQIDLNLLQKIDHIYSSNFNINETISSMSSKRKKNGFQPLKIHRYYFKSNFNERGYQQLCQQYQISLLHYICSNQQEWGKIFKVRKIYIKFEPCLLEQVFDQMMTEINFFLGSRITSLFFMKKVEASIITDNPLDKNRKYFKVQFAKLSAFGSIVQIRFGFLKYSSTQIQQAMKLIKSKVQFKKFKNGFISLVPQQLYNYYRKKDIQTSQPFRIQWNLKIQSQQIYRSFRYYFYKYLQKTNFSQIVDNQNAQIKHFYKIIKVYEEDKSYSQVQCKETQQNIYQGLKKVQKIIFLKAQQKPLQLSLKTQFATQSSFSKVMNKRKQTDSLIINIGQSENLGSSFHIPSPTIGTAHSVTQINSLSLRIDNFSAPLRQLKFYQQIPYYQFFVKFCANIQHQQITIMKLLQAYQFLHYEILNHKNLNRNPMSHQLKDKIRQMYSFKQKFHIEYQKLRQKIKRNHYKDLIENNDKKKYQINLKNIPKPKNKLIQASIDSIKGQFQKEDDTHKYTFFLYSPFTFIYIQKQKTVFYYKIVNMMYQQQVNPKQQDAQISQLMLEQIRNTIKRQQYIKSYSEFFQGIKKYFQPKNPTQFEIDISPLINFKTQENILVERYNNLLNQFQSHYLNIFKSNFIQNQESIFLKEIEKLNKSSNNNIASSQKPINFCQILLKVGVKINNQQSQQISCKSPLISFIRKKHNQNHSTKAKLVLTYYSNLSNMNENQRNIKMDYFFKTLYDLFEETFSQLQRISITSQNSLYIITKKQNEFQNGPSLSKSKLINKNEQSYDKITQAIDSIPMRQKIKFKKIPKSQNQFIACQETDGILYVSQWIILKITDYFVDTQLIRSKFYTRLYNSSENLSKYLLALQAYINVNHLMNELVQTMKLPDSLYISEYVNNSQNRKKQIFTKKITKASNVPARFRNKPLVSKDCINHNQTQSKQNILPFIYRDVVQLYERLEKGRGLQAIKLFQIFQIGSIENLKNTYVFPNLIGKNTIVLHFQQKERDQIDFEIQQKKQQQDQSQNKLKKRKFIIYFVHCLNNYLKKQQLDKVIRPLIDKAIDQQTFYSLGQTLFKNPSIILQSQQKIIKKGFNHQFVFEVPFIQVKQLFRGYLKQHLVTYHYKTQFQSQVNLRQKLAKQGKMKNRCVKNIWLFNFQSIKRLGAKFGKCIYFLRIQIYDSINTVQNVYLDQSYSSNDKFVYMYPKDFNKKKRQNIKQYLIKRKQDKQKQGLYSDRKDNLITVIKFQMIHILGTPIIASIGDAFELLLCDAFEDYYFQNEIFYQRQQLFKPMIQQFKNKKNSLILQAPKNLQQNPKSNTHIQYIYSQIHETASIKSTQMKLQKSFSSPIERSQANQKSIKSSIAKQTSEQLSQIQKFQQKLFEQIKQKAQDTQKLLPKVNSVAFYLYKTSKDQKLYFRNILVYFNQFINKFKQILVKSQNFHYTTNIYKSESISCSSKQISSPRKKQQNHSENKLQTKLKIYVLFYMYKTDDTKKFWVDQIETGKKLSPSENIKKIGFIFSDHVFDTLHLIEKQTSFPNINQLKTFQCQKSFCQNDFMFKRSVFIDFQITKEYFACYSYNFQFDYVIQIRNYLDNLQTWVKRKYQLLTFIKQIKQKNQYIIPEKIISNSPNLKFIQKIYQDLKNQRQNILSKELIDKLKVTQILKALVLNDFPPKKQISHYDYQQLYENLVKNKIDYSKYPEYKPKDKGQLQRLGWQYMSILRHKYLQNQRINQQIN